MKNDEFTVIRVDSTPVWFSGYTESGNTAITIHYTEALRMNEGEAYRAKFDLEIERGGVWSVRKVYEE